MSDEPAPLAIDGGMPVRSAPWPTRAPFEGAADADPVAAFEGALAECLDLPASAVIMCATPAEAYHAALSSVERRDRTEAILPDLLARPIADAAREHGWTVVPGEVDADTAALSSRGIARAMGDGTALAIVRHPFGHPSGIAEIVRLASDRGVAVIEDISGALGASFRGTPVGRFGTASILVGSEGDPISRGVALVVPDEAAAEAARAGVTRPGAEEARIALAELRVLDETLTQRRQLAWELTFRLRGMRGVTALPHNRWVRHAYSRYVVRLRSLVWKRTLEDTLAALHAEGVPGEAACDVPLHLDPEVVATLADDVRVGDDVFPIASRLPGELIAFPLAGDLTSKDIDDVAAALRKIEARSL